MVLLWETTGGFCWVEQWHLIYSLGGEWPKLVMVRSRNTRSHHNSHLKRGNCGGGSDEKWLNSAYILVVEPAGFVAESKVWLERTRPRCCQLWKLVILPTSLCKRWKFVNVLILPIHLRLFNQNLQHRGPGNNTFKMHLHDFSNLTWANETGWGLAWITWKRPCLQETN